jgi:acyl carrier protein
VNTDERNPMTTTTTIDDVRAVLIEALELTHAPDELKRDTALFGALPELDSFGVVALVAALEERFDITIDDDEFGAELFESVGSLTDFVDTKRSAG